MAYFKNGYFHPDWGDPIKLGSVIAVRAYYDPRYPDNLPSQWQVGVLVKGHTEPHLRLIKEGEAVPQVSVVEPGVKHLMIPLSRAVVLHVNREEYECDTSQPAIVTQIRTDWQPPGKRRTEKSRLETATF